MLVDLTAILRASNNLNPRVSRRAITHTHIHTRPSFCVYSGLLSFRPELESWNRTIDTLNYKPQTKEPGFDGGRSPGACGFVGGGHGNHAAEQLGVLTCAGGE